MHSSEPGTDTTTRLLALRPPLQRGDRHAIQLRGFRRKQGRRTNQQLQPGDSHLPGDLQRRARQRRRRSRRERSRPRRDGLRSVALMWMYRPEFQPLPLALLNKQNPTNAAKRSQPRRLWRASPPPINFSICSSSSKARTPREGPVCWAIFLCVLYNRWRQWEGEFRHLINNQHIHSIRSLAHNTRRIHGGSCTFVYIHIYLSHTQSRYVCCVLYYPFGCFVV